MMRGYDDGKAKSDYMRKAAGAIFGDAISFLDSLDHEVKKQNVCRYYSLSSILQLLSFYDGQNDGTWRDFAQLCSQFNTPKPALK